MIFNQTMKRKKEAHPEMVYLLETLHLLPVELMEELALSQKNQWIKQTWPEMEPMVVLLPLVVRMVKENLLLTNLLQERWKIRLKEVERLGEQLLKAKTWKDLKIAHLINVDKDKWW